MGRRKATDRLFSPQSFVTGPDVVEETDQALRYNPINAIPTDIVLLGRVIGLLRGVAASLQVPFTPMEMLLPYAEALLHGTPIPTEIARPGGGAPEAAG